MFDKAMFVFVLLIKKKRRGESKKKSIFKAHNSLLITHYSRQGFNKMTRWYLRLLVSQGPGADTTSPGKVVARFPWFPSFHIALHRNTPAHTWITPHLHPGPCSGTSTQYYRLGDTAVLIKCKHTTEKVQKQTSHKTQREKNVKKKTQTISINKTTKLMERGK